MSDQSQAIESESWRRLRDLVKTLHPSAKVEAIDRWRGLDDEQIWMAVVGQVAEIGGAAPWAAIKKNWGTLGLEWAPLVTTAQAAGIQGVARAVQTAFAKLGVRYVAKTDIPSRKALAVAVNFIRINAFGGPRTFMEIVARVQPEQERCSVVQDLLSHIKLKGSRDFLMGLGAARNVIALDVQVLGILQKAGLPRELKSGRASYEAIESDILRHIAEPLGLEGIVVDRTLYQLNAAVKAALA